MKKFISILSFIVIANCNLSWGQDYHFSQYDAMPVRFNPGLTGMFKGYNYKAGAIYRNQWRALSVKPFSTFSLGYEMPLKDRWGVGGYITNYDGAKIYNEFNLVVSGAYRITDPRQDVHQLSVGLQAGFINTNINDQELTFNNQYDNGGFDPDLSSNESFARFSKFMPEINIGIYYKYAESKTFKPYGGFAISHITSPKNQFIETTNNKTRLPRKFLLHAGLIYKIDRDFTLEFKTREMWQGKASEYFFGAELSYLVDRKSKTYIKPALYYRVKDAVVVGLGVEYKNITLVTTYDITTSSLKQYNNKRGGLEFSLRFTPRLINIEDYLK